MRAGGEREAVSEGLLSQKVYEAPRDLVQLLDQAVEAAWSTAFYRSVLQSRPHIRCLDDLARLPITPIEAYRRQPLRDVITGPARVEWIAGAYKGQKRDEVPVAEDRDETAVRYDVLRDAVLGALPDRRPRTGAVVTRPDRRYFAAEVSTILGHVGVPTHVFVDKQRSRTYEMLRHVQPDVLAILADGMDESELPASVQLGVTFRRSQRLRRLPQLDMYMVDELGFLAHSTDLERWVRYDDLFVFERSAGGSLIVSAVRNRTQPLLRLETRDKVGELEEHTMRLGELSAAG